jgi:predicted PurR-regulated permease PerM
MTTKTARRPAVDEDQDDGWLSRERTMAIALMVVTAVCFYLCYLLALPFLPAIAWGVALAVVVHPVHAWLEARIRSKNIAAALAVIIVAIAIVGPAIFVIQALVSEAGAGLAIVRDNLDKLVEKFPRTEPLVSSLRDGEIPVEVRETATKIASQVPSYLGGSIAIAAQMLITLFMLFYFFRDQRALLRALWKLLPLSRTEADATLRRIEDTIFATLYGSVSVAIVQGTLGGFMFWMLGLPTPMLWGAVMAVMATIPMLGTFCIWMPAAIFLALEGEWVRAVILVAWGALAIGLIDNMLYPLLVGKRLRLHPLLVFIAVVGGLALFGAAGVVLGPVILSVTEALIDVWRRRTADGGTVEGGVEGT